MIFVLVVNNTKPQALELAQEVVHYLESKGQKVVVPEQAIDQADFIISLGGDGSILSLIHTFPHLNAPVLGVNFGTLGFLADISPANLFRSLDFVLKGDYKVQERMMLHGSKEDGTSCYAINEMVAHRGPNYNLVDVCLTVDGKYFNTFSADGVIVATPSGSTAYSLSAGGPIVSPELQAVVITPVCPHALSNRPIVLQEPNTIEVVYLSDYLPLEVAFDGICRFTLNPKEKCIIRPADKPFRMVVVPDYDYFATLRTKLNWTGSLRN